MGRADSRQVVWRLAQNVLGNFASKSVLNQIAVSKIVDLLVLDVTEYLRTSHHFVGMTVSIIGGIQMCCVKVPKTLLWN